MKFVCAFGLVLCLATPAAAVPFNVTLGKPVSITGEVGVIVQPGWPDATVVPPAPLQTLVDDVFFPNGTQWQTGTVWWDETHPGSANNVVEIDLLGTYMISSLAIQFDNNDFYEIHVRNFAGVWSLFVTADPGCCFGLFSRGGPFAPFQATAFRIDARNGDLLYSLSEFQAIGEAVPEPASVLLLGTGLTAFVARRRRARKGQ